MLLCSVELLLQYLVHVALHCSDHVVIELHTHDLVDNRPAAAVTVMAEHTIPPPTPQSSGFGSQCPTQSSSTLHIDLVTALTFAFAVALAFDLAVNKLVVAVVAPGALDDCG